jgi:hypothetical protein
MTNIRECRYGFLQLLTQPQRCLRGFASFCRRDGVHGDQGERNGVFEGLVHGLIGSGFRGSSSVLDLGGFVGLGFHFGFVHLSRDLLDGSEVAEAVVPGDGLDELGVYRELLFAAKVGTGDLQSVEQYAGALVIDVAGGEAGEDIEDGELDGSAVVNGLHSEHARAAGDGSVAAGAVMVVAELLATERRRAAARAVGLDVAAEIAAAWIDVGWVRVHVVPPVLWS